MVTETFVDHLASSIREHWDLPAFSDYDSDEDLTYGEVADRILWLHYIFRQVRIRKGQKIAVIGKNSKNWSLAFLATVTHGAIIVPILPDFHADDIHHIVNHSDSVLLFTSDQISELLDESKMPNLDAIISLSDFRLIHYSKRTIPQIIDEAAHLYLKQHDGKLTREQFAFQDGQIENDDLAAMVYTSGTTGFSKGVMLSHRSLLANVKYAEAHIPVRARDRIVSFMPLAHSYGCAFEFLFPFSVGCHITFLRRIPSPKIIVEAFQTIRPRLILSVPLIIEKIYRKQVKPALMKPAMKVTVRICG